MEEKETQVSTATVVREGENPTADVDTPYVSPEVALAEAGIASDFSKDVPQHQDDPDA